MYISTPPINLILLGTTFLINRARQFQKYVNLFWYFKLFKYF